MDDLSYTALTLLILFNVLLILFRIKLNINQNKPIFYRFDFTDLVLLVPTLYIIYEWFKL